MYEHKAMEVHLPGTCGGEKEKTATYRQIMGNKLQYQQMLSLYKLYGLLDEEEK